MANTYVAYAGDGSTNTWTVPFAYLDTTHVHLYIDGVEDTTYSWVTDSSIAATSVPGSGAVVLIQRSTPRDALVTVIPVSGTLRGTDINNQSLQALYVAEEGYDALTSTLSLNFAGTAWDAESKRITLMADPVDAQDAATKAWVDSTYSSAVAAASSSASAASTSASNAATSATNAATSASAASTSATAAANSASAASGSETNAAASASAASTSASNAAASETAAAASETAAASSASSASTSASTATTQAGIATTQATNASNSASAASTSATNAAASETAAAASAGSASGSASTATTQAGIATTQATNASNSASAAATSASNASTSETNAAASASAASTSAGNAATSETNAASSASSASTYATNASTSASNAATSASNASTSASAAAASETAAALSYDAFDDRYLGSKTSDPTLDNDGNALLTGALYWNSVTNALKVYDGATWQSYNPVISPALGDLSDVTITGIAAGELLKWNGTGWINNTLAEAGISDTSHNHTLDSLSNVTITGNTSGEILKWNGTAWINNTLAEAGISAVGHTHAFADLTSKPTTLAGYGITDAQPYSANLAAHATLPQSASGDRWGVFPIVGTDGVMEVGKYIDFHESDADATDYSARLWSNSGLLTATGNFMAAQTFFGSDGGFYANMSGGNPLIGFDSNDYLQFVRSTNTLQMVTGGSAAPIKQAGKETVWVPAGAIMNNGSGVPFIGTFTGGSIMVCTQHAGAANSWWYINIMPPKAWNAGTLTFQAVWMQNDAGTGNVVWRWEVGSWTNGDSVSNTFDPVATVDAAPATAGKIMIGNVSSALTLSTTGTAKGDMLRITFGRLATDASDTFTPNAYLLGFNMHFTSDAADDT